MGQVKTPAAALFVFDALYIPAGNRIAKSPLGESGSVVLGSTT